MPGLVKILDKGPAEASVGLTDFDGDILAVVLEVRPDVPGVRVRARQQ